MVTNITFLALDQGRKLYYVGSKNPHVGALFTTASCLALHRSASLVQLPPQTPKKHERLSVRRIGDRKQ